MAAREVDKEKRMEILLEEIRDKVSLIAEGHSGLDRKIDGLKDEMQEVKTELREKIKAVHISFKERNQAYRLCD